MNKLKNTDCVKVGDMHFDFAQANPIHGWFKVGLSNPCDQTSIKIKLPNTALVLATMEALKDQEVEVYIVRKGSSMANLGMSIIKSSFEEGFTGADQYESMATEVREMIGTRILTKVEPEAEYIHRTESDFIEMRIEGKVVAACKHLHEYRRPDGSVLFEAANFGRNGMVDAVEKLNTEYFKRRQFEHRSYNLLYVVPANEAQHIEYLKLKYEYLKSLENETDNNK